MAGDVDAAITDAHERGWALVLAAVVRLTRDLDAAEDATQDAFAAGVGAWRRDGIPDEPVAWLTTVARRKALDALRRDQTLARKLPLLVLSPATPVGEPVGPEALRDERLRLIFMCAHTVLAPAARMALTARLVCGLPTAVIARHFLVTEATMAARITRAKRKIRTAGVPFRVPETHELPERLPSVLAVVAMLFTQGQRGAESDQSDEMELTRRARGLSEALAELMPEEPEVLGLLATIRLAQARGLTRFDETGSLVALEDQDRSRWDRAEIRAGIELAEQAVRGANGRPGPYALHAAIAALHAEAESFAATDWAQIIALYDVLLATHPSPVTALARAAARSYVDGPDVALAEVDALASDPGLATYYGLPAVRADLLRRLSRLEEAADEYARAVERTDSAVEREFLRRRGRLSR